MSHKYLRTLILLFPLLLLLGACHSTPDHAKYIPKNALMVAEVNTKELSKKIAWSMITNSNFWQKLVGKKSKADSTRQSEFIKNMTEAGVDELNTFYAYLKNNGTDNNQACFVALIPLKDAKKWEQFVKKTFNEAKIKEGKSRKEARLSDEIYVGWTKGLLVVVSLQKNTVDGYTAFEQEEVLGNSEEQEMILASHLESAFNTTEENSLLSDKRFASFEKDKHDLGFWVNIEALMNNYGSKNMGMMTGGLTLGNTMWRNSAFSAATHFEKGKVVTDMLVYSSDEMKEINEEFSNENVDEGMISRADSKGLDYLLAYHMSPQGTLKTFEKIGMLGLANGYLQDQKLTVEEILDAISGDLLVSVNNYSQTKETLLFDSSDASSAYSVSKTDMDLILALKINKKESFKKILNWATNMKMIEPVANDVYKIKSMQSLADSSIIILNGDYAVFSNKKSIAANYLSKSPKEGAPLLVKENISKYPFGMFFDFHHWVSKMQDIMVSSPADSIVYRASLSTFDNFVFNGGTHNNNTFKYKMSINLVNKNESSLIQLLDFGKKMQEAQDLRMKQIEAMAAQYSDEKGIAY